MSTTKLLDREVERIQATGLVEAVMTLLQRSSALERLYVRHNDGENVDAQLRHAHWSLAVAEKACQGLGVTVIYNSWGTVQGAILPKESRTLMDWFEAALKEHEPVSEPGLSEDISGWGYYDPKDLAMLRSMGIL
jgi:hypothetical protein